MARTSSRSTLHLQMGQETIYLLLTVAIFAAFVMAVYIVRDKGPQEDPPIITLAEANGYFFDPGSAQINQSFRERLLSLVGPKVQDIGEKYDAKVIEVIGHTDELPLRQRGAISSNLDRVLVPWFLGQKADEPHAEDNIGLGMSRAVAVSKVLRSSGLGKKFTIVPLSAGAFLKPDDTVTDGSEVRDAQERRRIEIRLRRRAAR